MRIAATRHSNERRDRAGVGPVSDVGPSSAVVGRDEHELAGRWALGANFGSRAAETSVLGEGVGVPVAAKLEQELDAGLSQR